MAGIIRPVIGSTADVAEKCYFIDGNKIAYELGKAYISNGSTLELLWEAGGEPDYLFRGILICLTDDYYVERNTSFIPIDGDTVGTQVFGEKVELGSSYAPSGYVGYYSIIDFNMVSPDGRYWVA